MEELDPFVKFFSFNNLKRKHIEKIITHSSILLIQDGECLYEQSTNVNEMLYLISGKLKIKIAASTTKEENITSKLMNEYHLLKEPNIHLNKNINITNQINTQKSRRSSLIYYEMNLKNKLRRNTCTSSEPSMSKSSIYNTTKPIGFNFLNDQKLDALYLNEETVICDWNIINNLPHYSSAYSLGQSLLLSLDRASFLKCIDRPLKYSFEEKKNFIINRIKALGELSNSQFDVLYHQFIWVYPKYNELIVNRNNSLQHFYIIYKGECLIQPNESNKKLLHLSTGDFIGLESLFNRNANNQLVTMSSAYNTLLIRFDVNLFNSLLIQDIREDLKTYYIKKQQILREIINRINTVNRKILISYKYVSKPAMIITKKPFKNHTFITHPKELMDDTDSIAFNSQDFDNIILKKKIRKNDIKTNKQIKHFSLQKKAIQTTTILNQFNTTNAYSNTISNVNTEPMTERSTTLNYENKRKIRINNIKSQRKRIKSMRINPESCNSNNKRILFTFSNTSTNNTPSKTNNYHSSKESPMLKYKIAPLNQCLSFSPTKTIQKDNKKYSEINLKFFQIKIQAKQPKPKTIIEKLHKTICDWTKTLTDPRRAYITNSYRIPLLSLTHLPH